MVRPIARGVLSFGLVAIPVEIHTATRSENVSFNLLRQMRVTRQKLLSVSRLQQSRRAYRPGARL